MPNVSDFRLGADVVASDGKKVGSLVSVIVDEQGRLLPITAVESATHDLVRLSMSGPDVRRQPLYLSYRPKPLTVEETALEDADVLTGSVGLPPEQEIANKPAGQIEIDRGENVMLGTTGHRLGRVQDALFDHGKLT